MIKDHLRSSFLLFKWSFLHFACQKFCTLLVTFLHFACQATPDFGCKLYSFAFESFSQSVCSAMVQEVKNALIMHEPRIQDIQVTIDESNTEGCLMINISYVVRATNNPYNLVFPFYLEEGGGDSY